MHSLTHFCTLRSLALLSVGLGALHHRPLFDILRATGPRLTYLSVLSLEATSVEVRLIRSLPVIMIGAWIGSMILSARWSCS